MAKSKYNPDTFPMLAEGYAREGMIDEDIATKLGIHPSTLYEYQKTYPEFSEAIKRGKMPIDFEVENAVLKRAKGFEYEEVKEEFDEEGNLKARTVTKKYMPPNQTSAEFWLTNRRSDKWRKGQHIDHTTNGENIGSVTEINFKDMSADDLIKLMDKGFEDSSE